MICFGCDERITTSNNKHAKIHVDDDNLPELRSVHMTPAKLSASIHNRSSAQKNLQSL